LRLENLSGEIPNEPDRAWVCELANAGIAHLRSALWCPEVGQVLYGGGIPEIVAVFYVVLANGVGPDKSDDALWIILGDVPFAYVVTDNTSPSQAFDAYATLMLDWAAAVRLGEGLGAVFPVDVSPTSENAAALESRIEFLRRELPGYLLF
jgi:hypothetical protein